MNGERLVFFDLETAGLNPLTRPIIQIGAIAVDARFRELERIELKVRFDEAEVNPDAFRKNIYSRDLWEREWLYPDVAAGEFSVFFKRHARVDMVSKELRLCGSQTVYRHGRVAL